MCIHQNIKEELYFLVATGVQEWIPVFSQNAQLVGSKKKLKVSEYSFQIIVETLLTEPNFCRCEQKRCVSSVMYNFNRFSFLHFLLLPSHCSVKREASDLCRTFSPPQRFPASRVDHTISSCLHSHANGSLSPLFCSFMFSCFCC